jgi:hypothetical protein
VHAIRTLHRQRALGINLTKTSRLAHVSRALKENPSSRRPFTARRISLRFSDCHRKAGKQLTANLFRAILQRQSYSLQFSDVANTPPTPQLAHQSRIHFIHAQPSYRLHKRAPLLRHSLSLLVIRILAERARRSRRRSILIFVILIQIRAHECPYSRKLLRLSTSLSRHREHSGYAVNT